MQKTYSTNNKFIANAEFFNYNEQQCYFASFACTQCEILHLIFLANWSVFG